MASISTSESLNMKKRKCSDKKEPTYLYRRKRRKIEWKDWISASKTRNHLLGDPILDWFSIKSKNGNGSSSSKNSSPQPPRSFSTGSSFIDFIIQQGIKFEEEVVGYLFKTLEDGAIIDIGGDMNARSDEKYHETIKAMNDGVNIICSGIVRNY